VAVARASEHAAAAPQARADGELAARLDEHAREEREHVDLWDGFCRAVGGDADAPATPETAMCARSWSADAERPWLRTLMTLHAIEAAQPAIAATKRDGLLTHYGLHEGAATAYFAVHEQLDVEHAAAARTLIEAHMHDADADALLSEAELALRANWLLLDGVERAAPRS
jgi:pyrroloquinoline quinone (PQQ) biosynthesis protein C